MILKYLEFIRMILKESPKILSIVGAFASVIAVLIAIQIKLGLSKEFSISIFTSIIAFAVGALSAYIAKGVKKVSPRRVFISYPVSAKEHAFKLADAVRDKGYKVWLDEEQIKPGDKWETRIRDAISDSDVFIVLLNENYSKSGNVMFELGYAAGMDKLRIVPVLLDDIPVPSQLEKFRFVDASMNIEDGMKKVLSVLV